MDSGGSGATLPTQIAPPHLTNPSLYTMDRDNSEAPLPAQIVTQYPQLFASSGMSSSTEQSLKKFYKGEPLALGITQMLTGILGIAFGVVLDLVNYHSSIYSLVKTPYWTGIPYILSGSLSVAATRNPKMPIVKSMLGMNVLSAVAAGLGIMILSVSLAISGSSWYSTSACNNLDADLVRKCYENEVIPQHIQKGILGVFLVFNILEFCISISGAAFGCKASCRETFVGTVTSVRGEEFSTVIGADLGILDRARLVLLSLKKWVIVNMVAFDI